MIRARRLGDELLLEGTLDGEGEVFADADWIVPGLEARVLSGGRLTRDDASALLHDLARACVHATATSPEVAVAGCGIVAAETRRLLGNRLAPSPTGAPAAIVTSAEPDALSATLAAVADLATVVVAAEPAAGTVSLDLYPHVHRRGLRLLGVGEIGRASCRERV